jgi:hypothetical protein
MNFEEAIIAATELEAQGIIPYEIDENHFFRSRLTYPRVQFEIHRREDADYFYVYCQGETLLELYTSSGPCYASFDGDNVKIHSDANGKISFFEGGGLPFAGHVGGFSVRGVEPGAKLFAVFEVYGPVASKSLRTFKRVGDDGDLGVKLLDRGGVTYQIDGRNDLGHSHNTVTLLA